MTPSSNESIIKLTTPYNLFQIFRSQLITSSHFKKNNPSICAILNMQIFIAFAYEIIRNQWCWVSLICKLAWHILICHMWIYKREWNWTWLLRQMRLSVNKLHFFSFFCPSNKAIVWSQKTWNIVHMSCNYFYGGFYVHWKD